MTRLSSSALDARLLALLAERGPMNREQIAAAIAQHDAVTWIELDQVRRRLIRAGQIVRLPPERGVRPHAQWRVSE